MAGFAKSVTLVELSGYLAGAVARLAQPQLDKALKFIEIASRSEHLQRFNKGVAPDGTPWVPLRFPRVNSKGADKPLLDTGVLRASVVVKADKNSVIASSNHISAGVHQFGATIVPKKAKFLTIPLTKEARYAGSPRRFKRPLHFRMSKGKGKGVAGEQIGNRFVAHFALVKSVTVPARPFLGFSKELIALAEEAIADIVNRAMDPAARMSLPTGQTPPPR